MDRLGRLLLLTTGIWTETGNETTGTQSQAARIAAHVTIPAIPTLPTVEREADPHHVNTSNKKIYQMLLMHKFCESLIFIMLNVIPSKYFN